MKKEWQYVVLVDVLLCKDPDQVFFPDPGARKNPGSSGSATLLSTCSKALKVVVPCNRYFESIRGMCMRKE